MKQLCLQRESSDVRGTGWGLDEWSSHNTVRGGSYACMHHTYVLRFAAFYVPQLNIAEEYHLWYCPSSLVHTRCFCCRSCCCSCYDESKSAS